MASLAALNAQGQGLGAQGQGLGESTNLIDKVLGLTGIGKRRKIEAIDTNTNTTGPAATATTKVVYKRFGAITSTTTTAAAAVKSNVSMHSLRQAQPALAPAYFVSASAVKDSTQRSLNGGTLGSLSAQQEYIRVAENRIVRGRRFWPSDPLVVEVGVDGSVKVVSEVRYRPGFTLITLIPFLSYSPSYSNLSLTHPYSPPPGPLLCLVGAYCSIHNRTRQP